MTLSQEDVARLLSDRSAETRADVASKLGQKIDDPKMTEAELATAEEILRLMAKDVEVVVRRALSESLRRAKRLPHDLALRLAEDVEAVALPILTESAVLTDSDLIAIIHRGSVAKQAAIAGRPGVSEQVSDVLITVAPEAAVTVLMGNSLARISEESLGKVVDRFSNSEAVKESLAKRERLPAAVTERLVEIVSERLRDYLVSHHELPPALAADMVLQSRERALLSMTTGSSDQELLELVKQMNLNRRLTPFLILRSLCLGDIGFFEASMAIMAQISLANARALIHDGGARGLESLYTKAGLPSRLFPAMRVAVNVVKGTTYDGEVRDLERFRARVLTRILTQFEDFNRDDQDYLLDKLSDVLPAN